MLDLATSFQPYSLLLPTFSTLNQLFFSFPELSSLRMHFKYRGRGEQKRKRAGSLPAGKNLIETVKALETYFSCRHVFVCGIHTKFYWNCESCED